MSSAEEDNNDAENTATRSAKKRRVQRACDVTAARCRETSAPTVLHTTLSASTKKQPRNEDLRKESLEARLEKMEGLLQRLCPDADFSQELGAPLDRQSFVRDSLSRSLQNKPGTPSYRPSGSMSRHGSNLPDDLGDHELDASDDEYVDMNAAQLQSLQENLHDLNLSYRFFGKSSGANLIQTCPRSQIRVPRRHGAGPYTRSHGQPPTRILGTAHYYTFPEPDLIDQLVDLFFSRINLFLPLLHRPTFERHLRDGLCERASMPVRVCVALFGRSSRAARGLDRLALLGLEMVQPGPDASAGASWVPQFSMTYRCIRCVIGLAAVWCSAPQSCWTMIGVGLRLLQDVGRHRKRVYNKADLAEDEQWRRTFWVLVILDRLMSASLGRPCAIQEEDFDVDMPTEIDDDIGRTSKTRNRRSSSRLENPRYSPVALRTIYSINKSKIFLGFVGPHWEQHIVAELDSALNEWIDTVPNPPQMGHDRSEFQRTRLVFTVRKPLQPLLSPTNSRASPIHTSHRGNHLLYRSHRFAICTNAARSCAHVIPAFTAGIVLLLNIWGAKRTGGVPDPVKEMEDVHKCMAVLQVAEARWHAAGRLWDVLYELASVGDLPLPQPTQPSAKRERDSDSPVSMQSSASASTSSRAPPKAPQQPTQRVSVSPPTSSLGTPYIDPLYSHPSDAFAQPPADILPQSAQPAQSFAYAHLPTHSDELARVPVPGHVFQSAESWLAPHAHRPQAHAQQQHPHAAPMYAAAHQQPTSYGTPPTADAFNAFVASLDPSASTAAQGQQGQQGQDGGVDMWQTVPTGYEFVFPFPPGAGHGSAGGHFAAGAAVLEDWDAYISNVSGLAHTAHPTLRSSNHPHSTHPQAATISRRSGQGPLSPSPIEQDHRSASRGAWDTVLFPSAQWITRDYDLGPD
ncbi:hypothetical protein EDB83DRAFT_2319081 [Lactarius deliciosus]|nr:hypothetical protein EDB83DRAFT_2319081 [Lactarius deliciosus]